MRFIDLWTIITGAASIISLLIVMSDKLPKWKKYISPVGFFLGGFAIGRISSGTIPGAQQSFQDPRFMGFLIVLFLILAMLYVFLRAMIKRKQDYYAYLVVLVVLMLGVPQIMDKYFDAFPSIPMEDYLVLANAKEKNFDMAGAVKYLEKYKELNPDKQIRAQIEQKIFDLQSKQLKIE